MFIDQWIHDHPGKIDPTSLGKLFKIWKLLRMNPQTMGMSLRQKNRIIRTFKYLYEPKVHFPHWEATGGESGSSILVTCFANISMNSRPLLPIAVENLNCLFHNVLWYMRHLHWKFHVDSSYRFDLTAEYKIREYDFLGFSAWFF